MSSGISGSFGTGGVGGGGQEPLNERRRNAPDDTIKELTKGALEGAVDGAISSAMAREPKKADLKRPRAEEEKKNPQNPKSVKQTINQDPGPLLLAAVTRRKIRNLLEVANKNSDLPLTPEEFEFLAGRSIGLRFSATADKEYIKGIPFPGGDALSLSGYPKEQLYANRLSKYYTDYSGNWKGYVASTKDGSEGPRIFEKRVKEFIREFVGSALPLPNYAADTKTRDHIELIKLKHSVKFLLGNFHGADQPNDIDRYYGMGKCGTQVLGEGKNAGKLIKRGTLSDDFFDNLPYTEAQLESSIGDTYGELREAIVEQIWKQIRLHIRKLSLMSKEFP